VAWTIPRTAGDFPSMRSSENKTTGNGEWEARPRVAGVIVMFDGALLL
jgi:hypothetical protein